MSLQKKVKLEANAPTNEKESNTTIESVVLETRKVKALEKIANSLDALTVWFEEINKKEWSERLAFYLYEFYNMAKESQIGFESTKVNEKLEVPETKEDGAAVLPPPRKMRPKKDIEKV